MNASPEQTASLQAVASDLVYRLVGLLTIEDLEDPAAAMALSAALDVLEGKPDELPADLVEQLLTLKDKAERFRAAASTLGNLTPATLAKLAESMKAAGLLRAQ